MIKERKYLLFNLTKKVKHVKYEIKRQGRTVYEAWTNIVIALCTVEICNKTKVVSQKRIVLPLVSNNKLVY